MPRSSPSSTRLELFAQTAPGLESLTTAELRALGIKAKKQIGGVAFAGDLEALYAANLWLRTATRVVVRMGRFHASTFYELERRAKKLPWTNFLPGTGSVQVRVTCRKSRLYHSDAVAERVLSAISRVAPSSVRISDASVVDDYGNGAVDDQEIGATDDQDTGAADDSDSPSGDATQLFVVRIVHDECEVSADSSGALLHRRGYRTEVAKAPLRETLAAAMILASGWKPGEPLLDPLCGSGTIPIEAALIARGMAPGVTRGFQFMTWPGFDANAWGRLLERAQSARKDSATHVLGSDRDAGAVESARRNAERAGVEDSVQFSTEPLSAALRKHNGVGSGWIITNPPYGVRVGDARALRDLYASLGAGLKERRGWRLGVLTSDAALARQIRLPFGVRFSTRNGGIPVDYLVSEQPQGEDESSLRAGVEKGGGDV